MSMARKLSASIGGPGSPGPNRHMPPRPEEATVAESDTVPQAEYARVKTHLYKRIDTLKARAERAEAMLVYLADRHHSTLTGSKLHDPKNQDWPECECKTCAAVRDLIPEQAADALTRYRAERESGEFQRPAHLLNQEQGPANG